MKQAVEAGYYLEATALAESIISDRLLSYLRAQGSKRSVDRATVVALGEELRAKGRGDAEVGQLAEDVIDWGRRRNHAVHGIAKSEPGTPTMALDDFVENAERAAREGQRLARRVADWHKKRKREDLARS